ncbi:MAG: DUF3857 domain-containing protein [Myxococcota bacterium]
MRWSWVLASLALLACASFPKLDLSAVPDGKQYPDAKLLTLLSEQRVDYFPGGKDGGPRARTTSRWRVKVLKPTELPPVRAWYSRAFSRIESVRGRIIQPDGSEKALDVSKKSDHSVFDGSILFTDERVVVVPVPPVPVGGIFESEVVEWRDDVRPFVLQEVFGGSNPVAVERVVATAPKGWQLRWRVLAFDGALMEPAVDEEDGRTRWTFERKDLAPIEREPQGVPTWALSTMLAVRLESWLQDGQEKTAFKTPEEMSRWLAGEYAAQAAPTPEMVATVREVLQNVPDTEEAKAKALYEFACRRVQYCAVEIGYGGWIPHPAKSVHETRYGDCKDKATYLHSLLTIAGVKSAPTLIYSHDGYPRPFQLPSLGANFNHAILAVHLRSGTVYVDPTQRAVPFGELSPSELDAPVLELTPEGAPLKTTRGSDPKENAETQTFNLTLSPRGDVEGRFAIEATGSRARDYKLRVIYGTGKVTKWLDDYLWLKDAQLDDAQAADVTDFGAQVSLAGQAHAHRVLQRGAGSVALLRLTDVVRPSAVLQEAEGRKADLVNRVNETVTTEVRLTLPAGAKVTRRPRDVLLESPFGAFRLSWAVEGGVLKVSRQLVRAKRLIPPPQLNDFNAFNTRVLAAEAEPVVLELPALEASR